jgi:hypothetical protein
MEEIALIVGAILIRWAANGTLTKLLNATLFKPKGGA